MPDSTSLVERLSYFSEIDPNHDAVVSPALKLSYSQLGLLVQAQVEIFDSAGITSESVIGIKCADEIQHLVMCLASIHIGATSCTIPSYESNRTNDYIINYINADYIVDESIAVDPRSLDSLSRSMPPATPAPNAILLFSTSGTTGEPKLVVHHDSDLVKQAHRHINSSQERFACLASIEHNFVKRHRLYCLAIGATNLFVEAKEQTLVHQCQSLDANVIHISAFQAQELLAIPDIGKLSSVRLKLGGSHVPISLRQQLKDKITKDLQAGYGTTETGAISFTEPNDLNSGESVGRPLPGIEIRVVSPERELLGTNNHGEFAIRCEGMFRGYLGKPELTNARLEADWFYTGDIGYLDSEQRINLCGRSDDMFVFNSINIYPQDIESQIRQHPKVIDAAVFPKRSVVHGNIPVALVVIDKEAEFDLSELKLYVQERTGIRCPRTFTIVNEIPRNASGKISRGELLYLNLNESQIRESIIQALGKDTTSSLKPSRISAFKNGRKDISFREIGLDSLKRMEILVMIEINHDIIITPQELNRLSYLGDIASYVLSASPEEEKPPDSTLPVKVSDTISEQNSDYPYVVRLFKRVFKFCPTVAQLNRVLTILEYRLTPPEFEQLYSHYLDGHLISPSKASKFHTAIAEWFDRIRGMMEGSGKKIPEPFVSRRVAPTVAHFVGPGESGEKILVVCFAVNGARHLDIPNTVLLQHTNAKRYDLLIISEPLAEGYQLGVPLLGNNIIEVIDWLTRLELISDYKHIRTVGHSAGAYPAVLAGYRLNAEMAVSISGRFHSERHFPKIFNRIFTTWKTIRKGRCSCVLMCYDPNNTRDRNYARIIGRLSNGSLVRVTFSNEKVGHHILPRLLDRGQLGAYLDRTIFAESHDALHSSKRQKVDMNFPMEDSVRQDN